MTWEEKRSLVETMFADKTPDGKPCGVYIEWLTGNKKPPQWRFSIRGTINEEPQKPWDYEMLEARYDDPNILEWKGAGVEYASCQ
jgi:hypothetical protein